MTKEGGFPMMMIKQLTELSSFLLTMKTIIINYVISNAPL